MPTIPIPDGPKPSVSKIRAHRRIWTDEFLWLERQYIGKVERIVGAYDATGTIKITDPLPWLKGGRPNV